MLIFLLGVLFGIAIMVYKNHKASEAAAKIRTEQKQDLIASANELKHVLAQKSKAMYYAGELLDHIGVTLSDQMAGCNELGKDLMEIGNLIRMLEGVNPMLPAELSEQAKMAITPLALKYEVKAIHTQECSLVHMFYIAETILELSLAKIREQTPA